MLAAFPLWNGGEATTGLGLLAGCSLATLGLSLVRARLVVLPLLALAAEFVARDAVGHVPSGVTVAYAAGLLLLCELIAWAETLRSPARVDPAVVAGRAATLCAVTLSGALAAGIALAAGSISVPNEFVAGAAGAAAVAGLATLVWGLGHRTG